MASGRRWKHYLFDKDVGKKTMEKLKALFLNLELAEMETNRLDSLVEENPENEILEKEWDIAYKKEYDSQIALAGYIVSLTKGKIDLRTANMMIQSKREQLKNIILKIS